MSLTKEEFKQIIKTALNQRSRSYARIEGFGFQFHSDDTRARDDFANFESILKILGGSPPELTVIPPGCKYPQGVVEEQLHHKMEKLDSGPGRSLLLIHYSGHGPQGDLMLGNLYKPINWARFIAILTDELAMDAPLDVVCFLDSCYSGTATRGTICSERIVEVCAAVDATQTAFGNYSSMPLKQYNTFTSKMATHLSRLKGKYDSVDFSTAITAITKDSPLKMPSRKILIGKASICIQLDNTDRGRIRRPPLPQPTSQAALFRVNLSDKLTKKDADSLSEWVRKLDGSDYSLSFDGLYDANSSLLLVRAPYSTFVRMGLPEESFIGFVNGENKMHPRTACH